MNIMFSGWGVRHADGDIHRIARPKSKLPKLFDDRQYAERLIDDQKLEGAKVVKIHIAVE